MAGLTTIVLALSTLVAHTTADTLTTGLDFTTGFFNGSLPADTEIPAACQTAYKAPINCDASLIVTDPTAAQDRVAKPGDASVLDPICTDACASSLSDYEKGIQSACANLPTDHKTMRQTPLIHMALTGQLSLGMYWQTCKKDLNTKAYCNVTAKDIFTQGQKVNDVFKNAITQALSSSNAAAPNLTAGFQAGQEAFCSSNCQVQGAILANPMPKHVSLITQGCPSFDVNSLPYKDELTTAGNLTVTQVKKDMAAHKANMDASMTKDGTVQKGTSDTSGAAAVGLPKGAATAAMLAVVGFGAMFL